MPQPKYSTRAELVKERWEDAKRYFNSYHNAMKRELEFALDHAHYDNADEIQPVDPALFSLIRHKVAQILRGGNYFEVKPVDQQGDPTTAGLVKANLEQWANDPENGFDDAMEDIVSGALAARMWFAHVVFDPYCGPYGEVSVDSLAPWRVTWTPGFKSPNDKRCPWVTIEVPMLPEEIAQRGKGQNRWKNADGVPTDAEAWTETGGQAGDSAFFHIGGNPAPNPGISDTRYVTVLLHYERYVSESVKQKPDYKPLQEGDRFMRCVSCGFEGEPQSQLQEPLPEYGQPCPMCQGSTMRVDRLAIEPEVLAYRKGRRLSIVAPIANLDFYDGDWPYDMRGFPVIAYKAYFHPLKPIPNSDTFYYRPLACISDSMLRMGYDQMKKAHGILLSPEDGVKDAYGEPWAFSEYKDVAMYDESIISPQQAFAWFQPPGLNSNWVQYFNTVQGIFVANQGTGDIGLSPQQSKDIAVGTIRTLVETGEIPVDHHRARFQRFKSIVLTRVYEIKRDTDTQERLTRTWNEMGQIEAQMVRMAGMPGFDIVVTAEPKISKQEAEEAQAVVQVIGSTPPPLWPWMLKKLGFPPQAIEEVVKALVAMPPPAQPNAPDNVVPFPGAAQ